MALDTTTLAQLKAMLVAEKSRLEAELGRFAKPSGVAGDYVTQFDNIGTDQDENATEVEEYAGNVAIEGTLETELKEVIDALAKMENGRYGICEKTGEVIPLERLKAHPSARTLVGV